MIKIKVKQNEDDTLSFLGVINKNQKQDTINTAVLLVSNTKPHFELFDTKNNSVELSDWPIFKGFMPLKVKTTIHSITKVSVVQIPEVSRDCLQKANREESVNKKVQILLHNSRRLSRLEKKIYLYKQLEKGEFESYFKNEDEKNSLSQTALPKSFEL